MKKCYIVGAADFAPARFRPGPDDLVIAADAGCLHLERLGLRPDIILGDFDSLGRVPDFPDVEVSPVRKDDTDSMLAARRAIERGCDTLLFFGCLGGKRLDHTIANIQTIAWAASEGAAACLIGDGCCLTALRGGSNAFIGESAYISLESGVLIVYWADNPELPLPERGRLF